VYTRNDDGWVTAQIAEFPEAISQGLTQREARDNVLEALHDLSHEPTFAERVAFAGQAGIEGLIEAMRDLISEASSSLARLGFRDRVH